MVKPAQEIVMVFDISFASLHHLQVNKASSQRCPLSSRVYYSICAFYLFLFPFFTFISFPFQLYSENIHIFIMSTRPGGRQNMSELKLRRLLEHNQRLREDLARPRVNVSEASAR